MTSVCRCSQAHTGAIGRIESELDNDPAGGQPRFDCPFERANPLPADGGNEHRPLVSGPATRQIFKLRPRIGIEPVDLVPDFDQGGLIG